MARTRTIKVAELFDPIDIDLFGQVFRLRNSTRSLELKSADKMEELTEAFERIAEEELDEAESRKLLMPIYYDVLDLMLEPTEGEDGKKTHAKTAIKKAYDDDKIGLVAIRALVTEIAKAREEERRPT
jgi:hypothetical protein